MEINDFVWPQNQIWPNQYVEVFVLQMCCKCAAILLQIFGILIFKLFHHIHLYLLFCLHAKFHSSEAKNLVTSDFIARHWQNVLNSRKYQKIRYLTYFHDSALMGHGVHKYFRVFFGRFKIVLNGFENRGSVDVKVRVEEKQRFKVSVTNV